MISIVALIAFYSSLFSIEEHLRVLRGIEEIRADKEGIRVDKRGKRIN